MIRRLISLSLGLVGAALGGALGWMVVGRDVRVWEAAGTGVSAPQMVIVVFVAVVSAVLATFFAWRRIVGAPIEHMEWSLLLAEGSAAAAGVKVGQLAAALAKLGYKLELRKVDEATKPQGPADERAPLAGAAIQLRDPRLGEPSGRVVFRLPPPREEPGEQIGFVDAWSALDGPHEELAKYLIAAVGDLVPGVSYNQLHSALDADPASAIRRELGDKPRHLEGVGT